MASPATLPAQYPSLGGASTSWHEDALLGEEGVVRITANTVWASVGEADAKHLKHRALVLLDRARDYRVCRGVCQAPRSDRRIDTVHAIHWDGKVEILNCCR